LSIKVGKTKLITLMEAEAQFGVSHETLRRAVNKGTLKAVRVAQRTFVKPEDVKRWIEKYYHPEKAQAVRKRWEREKHEKGSKRKKR